MRCAMQPAVFRPIAPEAGSPTKKPSNGLRDTAPPQPAAAIPLRLPALLGRLAKILLAACVLAGIASPAAAHGFGMRFDLPLPLWFWIVGAGATIALSFVVAAIFIREHGVPDGYPRYNLLRLAIFRGLAHPAVVETLRGLVVAFFVFNAYAGLAGTQDPYNNIIVTTIWIIWWVGLAFICALFGDLWRLINPLRTLFVWAELAFSYLTGGRRLSLHLPYPRWLGVWPAVILFFVFAWSELVWQTNDVPRELARAMLVYAGITWLGMFLFGRELWLQKGEAFTLAFGLFARFSPTEHRVVEPATAEGEPPRSYVTGASAHIPDAPVPLERQELNLRPPAVGLLDHSTVGWSFVVFVLLMLATVTFDGFIETATFLATLNHAYSVRWIVRLMFELNEYGIGDTVFLMSLWLVIFPLGFVVIYFITAWLMNLVARPHTEVPLSIRRTAFAFVLTLVPIAIAYHLAHYLQFLLTSGQFMIPLLSDPLGRGWDLFGTADFRVNIGILNPYFVWYSATAAIVIGHVLSVYIAHVVAMRLYGNRTAALMSQIPMVLLMIGYTMLSFWILAQPIVGH